jgi:glycosyltransferase involved in cell wall biosynthesis
MRQYLQLGPEIKPGHKEILATHIWRVAPELPASRGEFVPLRGTFSGARHIVSDYCWADGKLALKGPILKEIREDKRKAGKARGITWGGMGFGYGGSFKWFNYVIARELLKLGIPTKTISWGNSDKVADLPRVMAREEIEGTISILNARRRVPAEVFQKTERLSHALMGYFQCEGTLVAGWLLDFFKHFDAMLATSNATKEAIVNSGITCPVHVFGHGIDPEQFPLIDRPVDRKPYTFIHLADVQARKGTDVLIEAFKAVPRKNSRLYIKAQWENPESKDYRKRTANDPRIVWDFKSYPPMELKTLLAGMDCGVFPSRAEGFGMPKLECEATGLPCIATDAFGYKDTSVPNGTLLLKVKSWPPSSCDGGVQAEPDKDHLIDLMTRCVDNPTWAKTCGQVAGKNAHAFWKWSDKLAELLPFLNKYGLDLPTARASR